MDEIEIFKRVGMALAIGMMFGIERGWETRGVPEGTRIAGVRSFALIGLLGGIWGIVGIEAGQVVLGLSFATFAALLIAAHVMRLRSSPGERSVTTLLAALLAFGLGALAAHGHLEAAAAAGVVALALLALKQPLHRFVNLIDPVELKAAVQLLLISVVLLPVLPDRGFGPDEALNPFRIWLVVVLITAIGFVGYVAIQFAGVRLGAMMTGVFGGLASSTALSLTFARFAREAPELGPLLAAGVSVANALMALRILAIAAVLSPALLTALALPMSAMAAVGLAGAGILWYASRGVGARAMTPVANPFELFTAIKFSAFLAAVVVFSVLMRRWFGDAGVYAVAAISGVADVDAITVSMSRMAGTSTMTSGSAAAAVCIAAIVNNLIKAGITVVVGNRAIGGRVVAVAVAMSVATALLFAV